MAINNLDDLVAGMAAAPMPSPIMKNGITMGSIGAMRAHSFYYSSGIPGAATAPSSGVDGAAVTSTSGAIMRTNPASGNTAYMSRFAGFGTTAGTLWLIDRVWENSGLSVTSTSPQSITPATLPARDANGTTDGEGIMFAIEVSGTMGAGTPTMTLTYTNSANTPSKTATHSVVAATAPVGTFEVFGWAAGDTGVRAPTSFQLSTTRTSGTMHLVGFRVLAQLDIAVSGVGNAIDAITGNMPKVYDNSNLQLIWWPSTTAATNVIGTYSEAHG